MILLMTKISLDDNNLKLKRSHSIVSFKDVILLSLLFCKDLTAILYNTAEGYRSKPIETPFSDFASYLTQLKGRRLSQISSFRRLKSEKVIKLKDDKIQFDTSSNFYQEMINLKFRFFTAQKKWNGYWTLVLFDIPEKHRQQRDYLRKFLTKLGFVQWQRSVWVTINDISDWLNKIFTDWDLGLNLWSFKAQSLFQINDHQAIKKLFLDDNLEKDYADFVQHADLALKQRQKEQMKRLIEYFPELILEDKGIPDEFFNNPKIRFELWERVQQMKQKI